MLDMRVRAREDPVFRAFDIVDAGMGVPAAAKIEALVEHHRLGAQAEHGLALDMLHQQAIGVVGFEAVVAAFPAFAMVRAHQHTAGEMRQGEQQVGHLVIDQSADMLAFQKHRILQLPRRLRRVAAIVEHTVDGGDKHAPGGIGALAVGLAVRGNADDGVVGLAGHFENPCSALYTQIV